MAELTLDEKTFFFKRAIQDMKECYPHETGMELALRVLKALEPGPMVQIFSIVNRLSLALAAFYTTGQFSESLPLHIKLANDEIDAIKGSSQPEKVTTPESLKPFALKGLGLKTPVKVEMRNGVKVRVDDKPEPELEVVEPKKKRVYKSAPRWTPDQVAKIIHLKQAGYNSLAIIHALNLNLTVHTFNERCRRISMAKEV